MFQHRIYRQDLKYNRNIYYVFGDNVARAGYGGQAKEMRGEPNAVGVVTKWKPTNDDDAFFSDDNYQYEKLLISEDLERIHDLLVAGKIVVFPSDGLGTGLSELPIRAPKLDAFIRAHVRSLIDEFAP